MAKFSKTPFAPNLRGKLGATMFSENRYGPFIGMKPEPVKRDTPALSRVKGTLAELSRIWSYKLSDAQYEGWTKYAEKYRNTDSSGNTYNPAPRDIFTNHNSNLLSIGLPIILDPPEDQSLQNVRNFKFEFSTTDELEYINLFFTPELNENTRILIFATHYLKNSIFYFKDTWFRKIGYIDNSFKSGDSILSLHKAIFPYRFYTNFKIAFRFKVISSLSGISSPIIKESASFRAMP